MNIHRMPEPLRYIEDCLRELGYQPPSGKVVRDFVYQVPDKTAQVALIAFGDAAVSDISTSCISVEYIPSDDNTQASKLYKLQQLRYAASPIALLASSNQVEVWPGLSEYPQNSKDLDGLCVPLSYDQLPQFLNERKTELSPRPLLAAKRRQKQLTLFDRTMDASELEDYVYSWPSCLTLSQPFWSV